MKVKVIRAVLALAALWLAALPGVAQANATPTRTQPGSGGLLLPAATSDVRIERERLSIDLTQNIEVAAVRASYELANVTGREVALDLLFVAPDGDNLQASLAGAPLPVRPAEDARLPEEWLLPNTGLDPRTGEAYPLGDLGSLRRNGCWAFAIRLSPNARQVLDVQYQARLGYDRSRAEYILRHLVYVLGPAENWAGFGGLEVSALLPDRYMLTASPPLAKVASADGVARYEAKFQGIPAPLMRFTTMRVPNPWDAWLLPVQYGVPTFIGLVVAILAGALCSRLRGAGRAFLVGGGVAFVLSMVLGVGAAMLVTSVGPLASAGEDLTAQQSYFYMLGIIFWALLAMPFVSSLIAAAWAGLGARGRPAPPPPVPLAR